MQLSALNTKFSGFVNQEELLFMLNTLLFKSLGGQGGWLRCRSFYTPYTLFFFSHYVPSGVKVNTTQVMLRETFIIFIHKTIYFSNKKSQHCINKKTLECKEWCVTLFEKFTLTSSKMKLENIKP